jgi:hypothetical protein
MNMFLSYTRSKDDVNVVAEFRARLESEIRGREPGSVVFQDKNIDAGQPWPNLLKEKLDAADVLVVLVSPAYFLSEWCRKEYEYFTNKERAASRHPRVLPVLWMETARLSSPGDDDIARQLTEIQHDDWHRLRHKTWDSEEIRQRIDELAGTAIGIASRVE